MRYLVIGIVASVLACSENIAAPDHPCGKAMVAVLDEQGPPLAAKQEHNTAPGQQTAYYERWFYLSSIEAFSWGGLLEGCHVETLPRLPGDLS